MLGLDLAQGVACTGGCSLIALGLSRLQERLLLCASCFQMLAPQLDLALRYLAARPTSCTPLLAACVLAPSARASSPASDSAAANC